MSVALESNAVFVAIEYMAIFCSGLSGGLAATRKRYDIFTILMISWVTALGGGIVRDVLLGSLPPVGITDKGYVLSALLSGIVIAFAHPEIGNLTRSMIVVDAMALGLFAVNGTAKAMAFHTSGMTAVFMGMFTALAGGVIRDTLLNEVPSVIRDKHWYAVPSFIGCVLTVIVGKFVEAGKINLRGEMVLDLAIVALIVALRLLSVKFNIMLPGAMERERAHLRMRSRYLRRPVVHPQVHEPADHEADVSITHNPDETA
ncbi:MAG: trimeric intracellular cation channel family protein [Bifidobacterium crudilactis]|uniref:trimeric intracellular cation channel family protein n=1 Tax=Bifidobacterium crudilactis TaxID=327277 RepID=UPI003F9CD75A